MTIEAESAWLCPVQCDKRLKKKNRIYTTKIHLESTRSTGHRVPMRTQEIFFPQVTIGKLKLNAFILRMLHASQT